jgi:hypothetical protein
MIKLRGRLIIGVGREVSSRVERERERVMV